MYYSNMYYCNTYIYVHIYYWWKLTKVASSRVKNYLVGIRSLNRVGIDQVGIKLGCVSAGLDLT